MSRDYPDSSRNQFPGRELREAGLFKPVRTRLVLIIRVLGKERSTRLRKLAGVCEIQWALSRFSTRVINSPAEMFNASASTKTVARAGPFSARSSALIWLRSVFANSASWSCVKPCCKRSSCNTSPKIAVGSFLSRIGRQGLPIWVFLSAYGCMRYYPSRNSMRFWHFLGENLMSEGNSYNGYSWKERDDKFKAMKRQIAVGELTPPSGHCALCGDSEAAVEYHDEDYSIPYNWKEPAAYALCRHCHLYKIHLRFARPILWQAFLAHVRRGGYASDLANPRIKKEFEACCKALKNGQTFVLSPLRPYTQSVGDEWFAKLRVDRESMTDFSARPRQ